MKNAFNMVSRQALLSECSTHFPELLPWASWCYSQHPILWHPLGHLRLEPGVQQGDTLGPLYFSLVLNILVSKIVEIPTEPKGQLVTCQCFACTFQHTPSSDTLITLLVARPTTNPPLVSIWSGCFAQKKTPHHRDSNSAFWAHNLFQIFGFSVNSKEFLSNDPKLGYPS